MAKKRKKNKQRNPVAKFMHVVTKPKVERDRTKYTRKQKRDREDV